MRLMLFFDGRNAKRAWPVVREYIRPNVKPKKWNFAFRDLADLCLVLVHRQLQLTHDFVQAMQRRFGVAPRAQDHEVVGIGDQPSAEASLKAELLPAQHKPAHVDVREER